MGFERKNLVGLPIRDWRYRSDKPIVSMLTALDDQRI